MAPTRVYSSWNERETDNKDQVEPFRKFFFICEGANTEVFYFKKLVNLRKELGIHAQIDIRLLEKTEDARNFSNPKKLIMFAEEEKQKEENEFDLQNDKMVVVIDTDIYRDKPSQYVEVLMLANKYGDILAVTNPAFELFLLLHYSECYEEVILPNKEEILANRKVGKKRYVQLLFSQKSNMNSRTNEKIGELARDIDIAIEQEQRLNQDITCCLGQLTCNIGKIIDDIRNTEVPI